MKNSLLKFIPASVLLIVTGLIGLVKYLLFPDLIESTGILMVVFNVFFFAGMGLLINKNYSWTKYIVLVLAVMGIINFPELRLNETTQMAIISITYVTQKLLLIIAAMLLFKPLFTKKTVEG